MIKKPKMNKSDDDICPICEGIFQDGHDVVQIRQKGADGINAASVQRGDSIFVTAGTRVHSSCRKLYTNSIDISIHVKNKKEKGGEQSAVKRSARVSGFLFNSQTDCLFCGITVNKEKSDYSCVKTDNFAKSVLQCCDTRRDEWSFSVKGRIEYYSSDLHAADAVIFVVDVICP